MSDTVDRRNAEREKVEHSRRLMAASAPLVFRVVTGAHGAARRQTWCDGRLLQDVPVE